MNASASNERLLKLIGATPEQLSAIDRVLNGQVEPRPSASTGPLLLGMSAAAKFLGVSRATLWRIIKYGRLSKVEVLPGSFRVRRADLERFVGEDNRGVNSETNGAGPCSDRTKGGSNE